jgi:hypothetical protein
MKGTLMKTKSIRLWVAVETALGLGFSAINLSNGETVDYSGPASLSLTTPLQVDTIVTLTINKECAVISSGALNYVLTKSNKLNS